jgi:hypothetical protein
VSPDELHLEEIISHKSKENKNPKLLSRLHMEKSRYKFTKIVEPPQGKN